MVIPDLCYKTYNEKDRRNKVPLKSIGSRCLFLRNKKEWA